MAGMNSVVDIELFKGLDHLKLAKHVFPDPFHGAGANAYKGHMVCVNAISDVFQSCMQLNVQVGFKKWETNRFHTINGIIEKEEKINVVRCNVAKKVSCILYCKDCKADGNICTPIAKVCFAGDTDHNMKEGTERKCVATVKCLYFHNSHNWRQNTSFLFGAGFVKLNIPCNFIARGIYNSAIMKGRELLYKEKGEKTKRYLGVKDELKRDMGKEYVFSFIKGEEVNNRAYMTASNEDPTDWKKRLPRTSWLQEVDGEAHCSNMVRLYYCISTQLGISKIAAPFDIHYNDEYKMSGSDQNVHHEMFFQEESVLVGGFVFEGENKCQEQHTDYGKSTVFSCSSPMVSNMEDGSDLFRYGVSIIGSLVEKEERVVFIGNRGGIIKVDWNQFLVILGNMPHGGVTHLIAEEKQKIWPALHIHMDIESKVRIPGVLGNVPDGLGHTNLQVDMKDDDFSDHSGEECAQKRKHFFQLSSDNEKKRKENSV